MKRPTGITILALLLLLNGLALAIPAVVLYSHPDIGASFNNAYLRRMFPIDKIDATGMMFFSIIGAIFSVVVGTGLWFLSDKARWGLIFVTGLPLGRRLIGVAIALLMKPSVLKNVGDAFWFQTIAFGIVVWYLFQPHVKCAFAGREEFYDAYADVEHESPDRERS